MQDDRTYTRVLGFTELGILEMTRKRKSILYGRIIKECVPCKATGYVMSHETIAYELERELITYGNIEDEAVLIAAPKNLQNILQKDYKNIPFEIYFKDDIIEKYAIVRFGSKRK